MGWHITDMLWTLNEVMSIQIYYLFDFEQPEVSYASNNISKSMLLFHTILVQVLLARPGVSLSDLQSVKRMMSL